MKVVNYVTLGVISFIFLGAGLLKVFNMEEMSRNMTELNMGGWKMFLIGFMEIICVVGLWLKRTKIVSLLLLYSFAVAAFALHLSYQHNFFEKNIEASLMMILIPFALLLDIRFRTLILENT